MVLRFVLTAIRREQTLDLWAEITDHSGTKLKVQAVAEDVCQLIMTLSRRHTWPTHSLLTMSRSKLTQGTLGAAAIIAFQTFQTSLRPRFIFLDLSIWSLYELLEEFRACEGCNIDFDVPECLRIENWKRW